MTAVLHFQPDLELVNVGDYRCPLLTGVIQGTESIFTYGFYLRVPFESCVELKFH